VVTTFTRQTGEVMERSVLGVCVAAALALTACGGASDATTAEASPTTERDLDGTQNYATVAELHEAVNGRNTAVPCGELKEEPNPSLAAAQGTCAIDDDDELVLQLWDDAKHRDDGTTDQITLLLGSGLDYCYVLGRGEGHEGAWSVNASDSRTACMNLADALGGEMFDSVPESTPTAVTPPPAPATTTFVAPPPPPPAPVLSPGQQNALRSAQDYLAYTSFSRTGLIEQLEYENYSTEDASWAVDNVSVDWNQQAALKAEEYLDYSSFSRQGLVAQLMYEGFTPEQAEYGASQAYDG